MSAAKLTLEEAHEQSRCRICAEPIQGKGAPAGWPFEFNEMVYPEHIVLNFGKEFAHQKCLQGKD